MLRTESAEQMPHFTQTVGGLASCDRARRGKAGYYGTWEGREEDGENAEEEVRVAHCGG